MGRKLFSKAICQTAHAELRAVQRIGYIPNLNQIVKDIQAGKLKFIKKKSNRVSIFEVILNDRGWLAVYDKHRKTIVTFLPQ